LTVGNKNKKKLLRESITTKQWWEHLETENDCAHLRNVIKNIKRCFCPITVNIYGILHMMIKFIKL